MKLIIVAAACLAALGAQAQANKCIGPGGKVSYSDTGCPTDAKGTLVRTDRPNSVDTSHSYRLHKQWGAEEACDAARETLRHNDSYVNKERASRACASPGPSKQSNDDAALQRAERKDAMMKNLLDSQKKYHDSLRKSADTSARALESLRR